MCRSSDIDLYGVMCLGNVKVEWGGGAYTAKLSKDLGLVQNIEYSFLLLFATNPL